MIIRDGCARQKLLRNLVHWACAHRDHEVAILAILLEILGDRIETSDVARRNSASQKAVNQILRRYARLLGFAITHKVDVRHNHFVGAGKAVGKLLEKEARATVLVRLKDADESLGIVSASKRAQRFLAFCRMVGVVVVDLHAGIGLACGLAFAARECARAQQLAAAIEAAEFTQRASDVFPVGADALSALWLPGIRLVQTAIQYPFQSKPTLLVAASYTTW